LAFPDLAFELVSRIIADFWDFGDAVAAWEAAEPAWLAAKPVITHGQKHLYGPNPSPAPSIRAGALVLEFVGLSGQ
jgi:hypothetical protein